MQCNLISALLPFKNEKEIRHQGPCFIIVPAWRHRLSKITNITGKSLCNKPQFIGRTVIFLIILATSGYHFKIDGTINEIYFHELKDSTLNRSSFEVFLCISIQIVFILFVFYYKFPNSHSCIRLCRLYSMFSVAVKPFSTYAICFRNYLTAVTRCFPLPKKYTLCGV